MVKKPPHELSLATLQGLAKKKRKNVCLPISTMNKKELIKYLGMSGNVKITVKELKDLAKEKKDKECFPLGEMDKGELIEYIYGKPLLTFTEFLDKDKGKDKDKDKGKGKGKGKGHGLLNSEIYKKLEKRVKGELLTDNFHDKITNDTLMEMFKLYDKYFFKNKLKKWSKERNCEWMICWDDGCIKDGVRDAAGLCHYLPDKECLTLKIELSRSVFKRSLRILLESGEGSCHNSGLTCTNLLSCLQITFEHEMIHGLLGCLCNKYWFGPAKDHVGNWDGIKSPKDGHGKTFMSIVNNLFGHTDYKHKLTWKKKAVKEYDNKAKKADEFKKNIKVGDLIKANTDGPIDTFKVIRKNPKTVTCMNMRTKNEWRINYRGIIEIVGKIKDKTLSDKMVEDKTLSDKVIEDRTVGSPLSNCVKECLKKVGSPGAYNKEQKDKKEIERLKKRIKKLSHKKKKKN